MSALLPADLLLAVLRHGRGAADAAGLDALQADPQADWPGLLQLARRWHLLPALARAGAPLPPAVAAQLQAAVRPLVAARLQLQERLALCIERLLQDGVAAIVLDDAALLDRGGDAVAPLAGLRPRLLVRPEHLERAQHLLTAEGPGAVPVADLAGAVAAELARSAGGAAAQPASGASGAAAPPPSDAGSVLGFDAVCAWAEPLAQGPDGGLRLGAWQALLLQLAALDIQAEPGLLLRRVLVIAQLRDSLRGTARDTARGSTGAAADAAIQAGVRQAGLQPALAVAERLAQRWLGTSPAAAVPADGGLSLPASLALDALARRGPDWALEAGRGRGAALGRSLLQAPLARALAQQRLQLGTPPPAGLALAPRPAPAPLALSYDGRAADGLGAQLQRIYSLYAVARSRGLAYVHSPVRQLLYQGLQAMVDRRLDDQLCARANAVFPMTSDPVDLARCVRVHISVPPQDALDRYAQAARDSGRPVLMEAHDLLYLADHVPRVYHALRPVSPFRGHRPGGPLQVCVHMRRGDRVASQDPRLQPNQFFVQLSRQIGAALQARGLPHRIRLHTELPAATYTLEPRREHMFIGLHAPVTVTPQQHRLDDFDHVPGLELVLNIGPVETLCEFATADVLVLSYSSFSYTGALLNPHGLVITGPPQPWPRNFHQPLPDWLLTDDDGHLAPAALDHALDAMLARRDAQARGLPAWPAG